MSVDPARASATLAFIRSLLLGSLAVGVLGTIGELILLGHFEMPAQLIPIAALGLTVPTLLWHAARPSTSSVRVLQALMWLFIVSGTAGVALHYKGNVEFEEELHPTEQGMLFFRKTIAGATPVLAPGSMVLLGLVGLAHAYRHPVAADD